MIPCQIGGTPAAVSLWERPVDWLVVPDLLPEDDKIYLLIKIAENTTANYLAFTVTGNYIVDWGDGNVENVASGVKAQHQYDYTDLNISTITSSGGEIFNFLQESQTAFIARHLSSTGTNPTTSIDMLIHRPQYYLNFS